MNRRFPVPRALLIGLLAICVFGTVPCARTTIAKPTEMPLSPRLMGLRQEGYKFVLKQEFESAIRSYTQARELALKENQKRLAILFLNNIAGSHLRCYQYREAARHYNLAIREAEAIESRELVTLASLNLAAIHLAMGQALKASDAIAHVPRDGSTFNADTRLDSFLQLASIFTRLGGEKEAFTALDRATQEAELEPPTELVKSLPSEALRWSEGVREGRRAWVFSVRAECLNWLKRFDEAEPYVLEAFRIRSTFRQTSHPRNALQLAMIARNRGDFASAKKLLAVARNLDPGNRPQMHQFLLNREASKIELESGNFNAALGPLREALALARAWRMEVLPSDSTFLGFESYLNHELQGKFLDSLVQPSFSLHQKNLAEESFWVAEEARFASIRAAQFPDTEFHSRLPNEYWAQLSRFQSLQTAIATGKTGASEQLASIERSLNALEVEAGLAIPRTSSAGIPKIQRWRQAIPADEVVFSYYLAEPFSLAWVADNRGIKVRRIAGKKRLADLIASFRAEIASGSRNGTSSTGMELTKQLFGEFLSSNHTTPFWTMVIDQELATLPLAALPTGGDGDRYLVEDHTLRILPSAILLRSVPARAWNHQTAGIADPVYNSVDQRVGLERGTSQGSLQLSRLPASARELQASFAVMNASQWSTRGWTGAEATALNLRAALKASPDIVHVSAHFVANEANSHLLSIALTADPAGHSLFSSLDLNSLRTETKLIVLSGCNSSAGIPVSGIAVNGLARACLIAGASTVIATLWPTVDSDGPIFPVFYRHLLGQPWSQRAAAQSLRAAQIQMIRQGGWSSRPAYWAAYLAISKG